MFEMLARYPYGLCRPNIKVDLDVDVLLKEASLISK